MIDYFFNPKSVAVIGASRTPRKIGRVIFDNFLRTGFENVYPVNPRASEIAGKKCYSSLSAIKGGVDLAVISVPAALVEQSLHDCAEKGVKAVIIITAGFSEIGKDESFIAAFAEKMRVMGPNVIGVFDPYSGVDTIFNVSYRQERPPKGSIAFVSQSGAFGSALMDWLAVEGIGLSKFASIGNRADVDESDMLDYFAYDEKTKVITLYLEGVKDGRKFYEKLKLAAERKPVVVLKAGKTAAGESAARSHTGSLAGSSKVFSGVLKQAGALEAESIEELFDYAKVFMQPLPDGSRTQIITNGGGFGVLTADAVSAAALKLAEISGKTRQQMKEKMPDYVIISNPIDLTGDSDALRYKTALEAVMGDRNVDIVIVILLMQVSSLESSVLQEIIESKRYEKPLLVCSTGSFFTEVHKKILEENGIPVYPTPERVAKAAKALCSYAKKKNAAE